MQEPERDPVSPLAREILELFRGPMRDVRFPDADRSTLDEDERDLLEAQLALEAAEVALERAREVVMQSTHTLDGRATRAFAYARIFAEGDATLRERVDAIQSAHAAARHATTGAMRARSDASARDAIDPAAPKKRGPRSKKTSEGEGGSLFGSEPSSDSDAHEQPATMAASEPITNAA